MNESIERLRAFLAPISYPDGSDPMKDLDAIHAKLAATARDAQADYERGFRDGYERRHAEVLGALV